MREGGRKMKEEGKEGRCRTEGKCRKEDEGRKMQEGR
jgi:hypothetical protein